MSKAYLYRQFDKDGKLLYVGISNNCVTRTKDHKAASFWHQKIATITIETFSTRKKALAAERVAIKKENPIYNGNSEKGKKTRARRQASQEYIKMPKNIFDFWSLEKIAKREYRDVEDQIKKFLTESIAAYKLANPEQKEPLKLLEYKPNAKTN